MWRLKLLGILVLFIFVGCLPSASFDLGLSSDSLVLRQGESAIVAIFVTAQDAFDSDVMFAISGDMTGLSLVFDPPSSRSASRLLITVTEDALGSQELIVTGMADGLSKSLPLSLEIQARNPDLELAVFDSSRFNNSVFAP